MNVDHLYQLVHIPERKIYIIHVSQQKQNLYAKHIFMFCQYLMIAFNRFWEGMMDYKADIRFVNTWNTNFKIWSHLINQCSKQ